MSLARALAVAPEVLLCDESAALLDHISAWVIETLLRTLRDDYTVVMVSHDIDKARRLADHIVFIDLPFA